MSGPMLTIRHNSVPHWTIRALWAAATVAFVLYIPIKTQTGTIGDFTSAFEFAIAAMALNLAMGYGGIISLGHSAYFGVGGYTTAILVDHYGWSQGWTLLAAAAVGFVVGCATALPALRLKGVYLALVTLGLAVLFPQLVKWKKLAWLTDGARGIDRLQYKDLPSLPFAGQLRASDGRAVWMYWLAFTVLAISYLVCRGIVKSRVGRALVAIRDNETAAAVMGINLARTKTLVFGVSASMCAVGGSLLVIRINVATPDGRLFTLLGSITFLLIMVLGGAATLWGPIVGAIIWVLLDTTTREAGSGDEGVLSTVFDTFFGWLDGSPATLILGLVLLGLVFVAPFGVVGLLKRLVARIVVIVPPPAGTGVAATVGPGGPGGVRVATSTPPRGTT